MGDIFSLCVCESACPPFPLLSAPLPAECLDLWLVGCCRNNQVICPGAAGGSEGEGSCCRRSLIRLCKVTTLSLSLSSVPCHLPPGTYHLHPLHLNPCIFRQVSTAPRSRRMASTCGAWSTSASRRTAISASTCWWVSARRASAVCVSICVGGLRTGNCLSEWPNQL